MLSGHLSGPRMPFNNTQPTSQTGPSTPGMVVGPPGPSPTPSQAPTPVSSTSQFSTTNHQVSRRSLRIGFLINYIVSLKLTASHGNRAR